MSSSRIEELKKKRMEERKKTENKAPETSLQKPASLFLLLGIVALGIFFYLRNSIFLWVWPIGLMLGFTLERSRFCFAASLRNPFTLGTTNLLKALIISLMVASVGFIAVQRMAMGPGELIPSEIPGLVRPLGLHTVIGGTLFGIGMVIAGGCASGTLMRIGEGFTLQLVVVGGFIMGTVLAGFYHRDFWQSIVDSTGITIYLPSIIGFMPALFFQLLALLMLYLVVSKVKLKV